MTARVVVDTAMVVALMDRLRGTADALAAVSVRGVEELAGSALSGSAAPAQAAAEVHRLGAALQDWVCSLRRSLDEVGAADGATAERFRRG